MNHRNFDFCQLARLLAVIALILGVSQSVATMAMTTFAEDVTGTWRGTLTTPDGRQEAAMAEFKQVGAQVTGWVGPSERDQNPISDGTITENKLTAKVTTRNGRTMTLDLTVNGNQITGAATRNDRPGDKATLQLSRNAPK